jgi:hypothetical protein
MKKFVFASVMALASVNLVSSPLLRAQSQDLSIKDPSEYNAYSMASTQADPAKKAQGLEDFLTKYPQSVAKNVVLNLLVDTYRTEQYEGALSFRGHQEPAVQESA